MKNIPINVKDHQTVDNFFRNVALGMVVLIVFLSLPNLCTGHDHHGHSHDQPASFKYSREANEHFLKEQEQHHHHDEHLHHHEDSHDHHHDHHDHHDHHEHHHRHAHETKKVENKGKFILASKNLNLESNICFHLF